MREDTSGDVIVRGAWYLPGGVYKPVLRGSNGLELDNPHDMLGWACFAWKYAIHRNGYKGKMILDSPTLGDAARTQIIKFQEDHGLTPDGEIGRKTGERLLRVYFLDAEVTYGLPKGTCWQVGMQESTFDVGAVGWYDPLDRGPVQDHIYVREGIQTPRLDQAVRPAWCVPRLGAHIDRIAEACDIDTGIAAWNCGEGGAEWWFKEGKPSIGSPSWWDASKFGDLSSRCWKYIMDVRKHEIPF